MGDDNLRDKEVVEDIINQVWKCTNILYKGGKLDSARVVLFLISTYKDGLFPSPYINDPKNTIWLEEYFNKLQGDPFYNKICNIYDPEIAHLHYRALDEVIHQLNQVNREQLEENYTEIFESLLKKYIDFEGKRAGEIIQPKEISKLMINLANLQPNAKVYNPFAGLASFAILLEENQEYHGQEINSFTWAIGQLRLKAHNVGYTNDYLRDDSINHWPESQKFDLVVASPPFFVPIPDHFHSQFSEEPFGKVQNFLVDKGIQSLNDNGQLITVLPLSFLFGRSEREKKLKKWLVQNDLVDTVIVLPSGLLSATNIAVCIVIFKKASTYPGYVRMIDASSFFIKAGTRKKILNDQDLFQLINNNSENEFLRYVSASEVSENHYNLTPSRYLITDDNKILFKEGTKLRDIIKPIREKGERVNKGKLVRMQDLKEDLIDFDLDITSLKVFDLQRFYTHPIKETCLLLSLRGDSLRPTYFKYEGTPVYGNQYILPFKVDESVYVPYLINELLSGYVKEQLKHYSIGAVPFINTNDLLDIVIKLPSSEEEQKSKVRWVKEAYAKEKKKELELFKKIHGLEDELKNQNAFLRHALAGPVSNAVDAVENIKFIINEKVKKEMPEILNLKRSDKHMFTLQDYLNTLEEDVIKIHQTISKRIDVDLFVEEKALSPIDAIRFCERYVKRIKSSNSTEFEIGLQIDEPSFHDKEGKTRYPKILANKALFEQLLDNLLDNAKKHGFIKGANNKIEIWISLSSNDDGSDPELYLLFSNSGNPLPDNFNYDEFIRKGAKFGNKPGDGFGGWYINEIIKRFNGKISIIDETGPEGLRVPDIVTSFEIIFPIHIDDEI